MDSAYITGRVPNPFFNEFHIFVLGLIVLHHFEPVVCRHGNQRIAKVNKLRYMNLLTKCGGKSTNLNLFTLPPCQDSFEQRVRRVSFQVEIWKKVHVPQSDILNTVTGHTWTTKNCKMQPKWTEGDIMPQVLIEKAR